MVSGMMALDGMTIGGLMSGSGAREAQAGDGEPIDLTHQSAWMLVG